MIYIYINIYLNTKQREVIERFIDVTRAHMTVRWSLVYCLGRETVACIALKCCLLIFAHHLLFILLPAIRGVGFMLFMLKWVLFVSCDLILKWSGSVGMKTVYSSAYLLFFPSSLPTRLPTYLLYCYIYLRTRLPGSPRSFLYVSTHLLCIWLPTFIPSYLPTYLPTFLFTCLPSFL